MHGLHGNIIESQAVIHEIKFGVHEKNTEGQFQTFFFAISLKH